MSEASAEALAALKAEIAEGWQVKIINHDYITDSRDNVTVTEVGEDGLRLAAKPGWSSQGRGFRHMDFTWGGDTEVTGRSVRLFHTPPPHTGKSRRLVKTFTFSPPREY